MPRFAGGPDNRLRKMVNNGSDTQLPNGSSGMKPADPLIIEAACLRAVFTWHADRWHHRVEIQAGSKWLVVLRSVEGVPEEDLPPSPAIQELHPHVDADVGLAVLGVGMSGGNHWSLVCKTHVSPQDGAGQLAFSFACRSRHPPVRIGNTYEATQQTRFTLQEDTMQLVSSPGSMVVATTDVDGITAVNQQLCLEQFPARNSTKETKPRTWQWAYTIQTIDETTCGKASGLKTGSIHKG